MSTSGYVYGPTFAEMPNPSLLDPQVRLRAEGARTSAPLDPINLFNISWRVADKVQHVVLPKSLTGVDAPIVILLGRHFPTGAHKVGPAYSCLVEKQLSGDVQPGVHTAIW